LLNYHEIELPEANLDAHWVYISTNSISGS
jgi:hypothetical protein